MFVDFDAANKHGTTIMNCGSTYTLVKFSHVNGANTSGCSKVNEACNRITRFLSRYQEDAFRDGQNILVLAMSFEELDKKVARHNNLQ